MPQYERKWDVEALIENRSTLAAGHSLQGVVSAVGHWCDFEVYVSCEADWLNVRLRATIENARTGLVVVDEKTIGDMQYAHALGNGVDPATSGGVSGILFSIKGRASDKFGVQAVQDGEARSLAHFVVRASGPGGVYGDRASRLPVQPFAQLHQQWTFADALAPGPAVNVLNPEPENRLGRAGRRTMITAIELTTDETEPRLVALQERNDVLGTTTFHGFWIVGGTAPTGPRRAGQAYTYPLRTKNRGSRWELTLSGLTAGRAVFATVSGYEE